MIVYTIKEGVPAKPPHMYTEDDFNHYENLKNGYKSPKPLLSVMKAVYDAEGRLVGHKKDSMYDPFLQTIQNKVYFAKSKEWTMASSQPIFTRPPHHQVHRQLQHICPLPRLQASSDKKRKQKKNNFHLLFFTFCFLCFVVKSRCERCFFAYYSCYSAEQVYWL